MTFPTAATTGVPDGVTLTSSGGIIVTKAGTVLDGLDIHGQVYIQAPNVTIQNCKISYDGYAPVRISQGIDGVVVKNCDIDGMGGALGGISGAGTFLNNNIYGVENGINVEGSVATRIEGNYIHDFRGSSAAHFDGIQIFGGNSNVEVAHNTVINDGATGAVSAVFVANTFGAISNVNVHDNYLAGGGFPLYFDGTKSSQPMTGVTWADNYVVKGGYGYEYIKADSQGHLPATSGNTEVTSGLSPSSAPDHYTSSSTSTTTDPTPTPTPDPTPTPTPDPTPVPTDQLTGTNGNDKMVGTDGADTMAGLAGNDTYTVNHTGDHVIELAGQGTDTVESSITYTLPDNVENLQLTSWDNIDGTGNSLDNVITGYGGANTLNGGDGNDTLNGWGGKDTLIGGNGKDVFQFSDKYSADGDKVMDFVHGTDKLDFSQIDANTSRSGDQHFRFDGYASGGRSGHLWAVEDKAADVTHVYGNVSGFQFHIDLNGTHLGLTASDLIL